MKIALLGATGRIGRPTLDTAVLDGHDVRALVRRPEAVPGHPGVTTETVVLDDQAALAAQLDGVDAVITCLRADRGDPHLLERTLPLLADAARAAYVRRVVHVGAFGSGESASLASWRARSVYATFERGRLGDHARALAAVDDRELEWTTVLPVRLRDGSPFHVFVAMPMEEVGRVPGLPMLPYANVARALVSLATDPEHMPGPLLVTTAAGVRVSRSR